MCLFFFLYQEMVCVGGVAPSLPILLWVWCRLAGAALIQLLKKKKKKKISLRKSQYVPSLFSIPRDGRFQQHTIF